MTPEIRIVCDTPDMLGESPDVLPPIAPFSKS